jgi:DNA polymerase I-like protein with 3'-5' exonuclease and polymerase domains
MKILVLDLETTVQRFDGKTDNSPFNPDNKCVSAHFGMLGWDTVDEVFSLVFHHNEKPTPDSRSLLEEMLKQADVLVAHNAKFDIMWLLEMGFRIPNRIYCTMIGEYILAKGQREELSLKATAERRDVTRKKSDLVDELFKSGTGFEAMPLDTVLEYAEADVRSCAEIYLRQQDDFAAESNQSLTSIVELMNEMLMFLVEIERNGIAVDLDVLRGIKVEYEAEHKELTKRLDEIVEEVMGDTPINLNSGADMTKVVYSREVIDRAAHQQVWNIGLGSNGKPLPPPRMNDAQFNRAVRSTTRLIQRTQARCCDVCDGRGKVQLIKKNGEPYKNLTKCKNCAGVGAFYDPTGVTAGLKLNPKTSSYASINGFKTDKHTIKDLIRQAESKDNLTAVEFLQKMSRLNAINTYLDSFIQGIETWTRADGLLHTNMNQCITATGRLSSSNPNFQNQPKRGFPVRKAVVSRFDDGLVIEADFSGLEFRVAGELSRDPQIIEDILTGKDIHKQTASIINQTDASNIDKDQRQAAKAYTFAPLYGGMGAGEPEHIRNYFSQFFAIYEGLAAYQKRLMDGVVRNGIVQTPSGRQYFWPNAKRTRNGRITNATQVVNYPVQGFATGDLVPLACIRAHQKFKELNLVSKLVLTVHDSIVVDCHKDELEQVKEALTWAMTGVPEEAEKRWNYTFSLPLAIEISGGKNWLDQVEFD